MLNFEPIIDFEEEWNYVQKRIKKLQDNVEGLPNTRLSSEDNIMLYTNIYNVCTAKPYVYCEQLYQKYTEVFQEYIKSRVLPSLQGKKDEHLLRELLRRWFNYKTMTIRLSRTLFQHVVFLLFIKTASYPSIIWLVCETFNRQVMDATLAMIDKKLVGETTDETLINNILAFYSEIGLNTNKWELKEFAETMMMKANGTFYIHVEALN